MKPVCVVIGGAGFVGSAVAAESRARGFDTRIITRDTYEQHRGTVCDILVNANGNSKKFLAAENPALEFDLSVRSVARSLQDFRPARYLHLSTVDVYADPTRPETTLESAPIEPERLSPYGLHKWMAECLVRRFARSWTIVRMGGFVGPGLKKNSIYDLLKGAPLRVHPDSAYQYQHTGELARIVFELSARPDADHGIFNSCGDGLVSIREIAGWVGVPMPEAAPGARAERYEISLSKIKSVVSLSSTRDTVRQFVNDVRAGHVQLA